MVFSKYLTIRRMMFCCYEYVSISLPLYWGERRLKVLISYVVGFPLFVIVLFNVILGVHFEPGLLDLIKN